MWQTALKWWRKYRWWAGGALGAVALLGAAGAAVWYVPTWHGQAQFWYFQVKNSIDPPDQPVDGQTVAETDAVKLQKVQEQVAQLEKEVVAQRADLQSLHDSTLSEQQQLQAAIAEVAKTNDDLEKQRVAWENELQQQGTVAATTTPLSGASTTTGSNATAGGKVNINTATAAELDALPGIGQTYAQRIVDTRTKNGPFRAIEDIEQVSGIGDATFAKIKDLITV